MSPASRAASIMTFFVFVCGGSARIAFPKAIPSPGECAQWKVVEPIMEFWVPFLRRWYLNWEEEKVKKREI
jgi:hypothetical protein